MVKRCDGIAKKKKLLEAAGEVFALKGYHDATVSDICKRAGANVAAVNYYFESKENLYVKAWKHAFDISVELYPIEGGVSDTATPQERLKGHIDATLSRIMDPSSIDFDIAYKEMANPTGLLSEVMKESIEPLKKRLEDIIRALLGEGATQQQVRLCSMSIHSQCFGPLRHERNRKNMPEEIRRSWPPCFDVGKEEMIEHIYQFSISGVQGIQQTINRVRNDKNDSKGNK